jgi:membrane protein YqaA with SNARE-associated domain
MKLPFLQPSEKNNKPWPRYQKFIESKPVLLLLSIFEWPRKQIRKLYHWVVGWSETKNADRALGAIAFAESSVFPVPPDPLLIATTVAQPKKYLRLAAICTLASIAGGILGYAIGVGLFESVGQWVITTYHLEETFVEIGQRYDANAFLTIFTAAFTPVPYKLITISAGVFSVNFFVFVLASVIGRGLRFFTVATLMRYFGKRYKDTIEKYIDLLSLAFVALLVLGVMAIKYL